MSDYFRFEIFLLAKQIQKYKLWSGTVERCQRCRPIQQLLLFTMLKFWCILTN